VGFLEYIANNPGRVLEMSIAHATYVLLAVAVSAVIGVSVGILVHRSPAASSMVTAVCATILTIPSFALFGLMVAWIGLGNAPAVVALAAYALLPIVRNTITGLEGVDPAIVESAKGMGLSASQRMLKIQLPLAWPVIIAGLRVATMLIVSIFAIAAYLGADGLGNDIFRGLSNLGSVWAFDVVLAATVAIVVVALVLDLFYVLLERVTTSRGIR
jgi:osmoprotectant transport system permease protein